MSEIPETMKAIQLSHYDGGTEDSLTVIEAPVPKPGPGQVLVRVHASPINPSDLSFLYGTYGVKKELPVIPGLEGSGTVVLNGGGIMGWRLVGKKVAIYADNKSDGPWAEYCVVPAMNCVPFPNDANLDDAAMTLVNPLTALAFLDVIRARKAAAVVHTAAASQLGRMFYRLCAKEKIPVVNIVRREEQVQILKELGAQYVLNSTTDTFETDLAAVCKRVNATLCFDAVAGDLTSQILHAMPRKSHVAIYGSLSKKGPAGLDVGDFIFQDKTVGGFWLTEQMKTKNIISMLLMANRATSMVSAELKSKVAMRLPLSKAAHGIASYKNDMTAGKILIVPSLSDDGDEEGDEE